MGAAGSCSGTADASIGQKIVHIRILGDFSIALVLDELPGKLGPVVEEGIAASLRRNFQPKPSVLEIKIGERL